MLPYSRHLIDDADIKAVIEVLRSDRLTTGPRVEELEQAIAAEVGAGHAVALSSGTAALHGVMHALEIGPGDEVIVPTMTFAASANAVVYQGGRPVFCDVTPSTLLIDPADVERKITPHTRAVIAVDYAGQPADYQALREICDRHHLHLVADACHSLGATYHHRPVGSLADLTVFSMHPVKPITAGEGGLVTTNHEEWARAIRQFRHHGIEQDVRHRETHGQWFYEMTDLGFNYRLTDLQCALALSQLRHLKEWTSRRQYLASCYYRQLADLPMCRPLAVRPDCEHAYHLFVVRIDGHGRLCRQYFYDELRHREIATQVHYIPVHLHPYYRREFGTSAGNCPVAEQAYGQILSLPLFAGMQESDLDRVVDALHDIVRSSSRHAA